MKTKKIIAVFAAVIMTFALSLPAYAEVPGAVSNGTKITYSLLKTNNIGRDGSVQVQTQTYADAYPGEGPQGPIDGFFVALDGADLGEEITLTVTPATGVIGQPFSVSFILDGSKQTFIPAGIQHLTDCFVNSGSSDRDGTTDDFLYVQEGIVGFDGAAIIDIKGTAIIPIDFENTHYANQAAATAYIQKYKHTFDVYGLWLAADEDIQLNVYRNTNEGNGYLLGALDGTVEAVGFGDGINEPTTVDEHGNEKDPDSYEIYFTEDFEQVVKTVTGLVKPSLKAITKPLKTTQNGGGWNTATTGSTPDVIAWLQGTAPESKLSDKLAGKTAKALPNGGDIVLKKPTEDRATAENNYVNVLAVVNDCITSYPNVTFTFNTAKENVITAGDYIDFYSSASSSAASTDMYKVAFGQGLFDLYGSDFSNNQPFDPNIFFQPYASYGVAYNLFTGALILNDAVTMQLADTNVFSYNGTSLTFDYQSLRDNVYTQTNTYLDLIHSMKLATSVKWYWDSLDIEFMPDSGDTGESEAALIEADELI
jgi:hypothetical protein